MFRILICFKDIFFFVFHVLFRCFVAETSQNEKHMEKRKNREEHCNFSANKPFFFEHSFFVLHLLFIFCFLYFFRVAFWFSFGSSFFSFVILVFIWVMTV